MQNPITIIDAIRKSFIGSEQVYTDGSCVGFYFILKSIFPQAVPYWSNEARHMITRIGRSYYDITGRVTRTKDYKPDNKQAYTHYHVAVAFPKKRNRKIRLSTPTTF